jgi:hypothetical protein
MLHSQSSPDFRQLRIQAKDLLRAVRAGDSAATGRALKYFAPSDDFKLAQAQLVVARESGFSSWTELKREVADSPTQDPLARIFRAIDQVDIEEVNRILAASPHLAGASRKTEYGGWEHALHAAANKGSLEICRALVDSGAEVYPVGQGDYPPVFYAHYSGNRELVEFLLAASQERDSGMPPTYGCGIDLIVAARIGMLDRVQMHVDRDPLSVFRRGCIGETVLHWPAHNGSVEIVDLLIDHGALIEGHEIGLYGGTALHWASEHAPECVDLLLKRGANPNARNVMKNEFEGYTPLHMSACQREQCVECAKLLLDAGSDPAARDAKGRTPLEVARACGHSKMAEFLS